MTASADCSRDTRSTMLSYGRCHTQG
jgi:hypothetical protein